MNIRKAISKYAEKLKPLLDSSTTDLPAMPASAEALTILALHKTIKPKEQATILWIHDSTSNLEIAHQNLITLSEKDSPMLTYFPPGEANHDPEIDGYRLHALQQLNSDSETPLIIATCIQAIHQSVPSPEALQTRSITFELDASIDLDEVTKQLQSSGYAFEAEVQQKGQAALKGGLLDVWSPTDQYPTRIELFGPTVESIRIFDPTTQRSIEKCPVSIIPPLSSPAPTTENTHSIIDHLPTKKTTIVWSTPGSIKNQIQLDGSSNLSAEKFTSETNKFRNVFINPDHPVDLPEKFPIFSPLKHSLESTGSIPDIDQSDIRRKELFEHLNKKIKNRHHVTTFCNTNGSLKHIKETLLKPSPDNFHPQQGELSDGFECAELKLIIASESNLYGQRKTLHRRYNPNSNRSSKTKHSGRRISDFSDIDPGNLVVHIQHGIGRYIGIQKIKFNNQQQEVLAIEYADDAKLYVPMSQAHLLSRYVGLSSHKAHLHKLGGKRWSRDKDKAQEAVLDLAADLLEVQAARNLLQGHSFSKDNILQHEFAAAFPFHETEDQIKVIRDVKKDMQSTRPMDRLICGDAGYGKTEVAMRAAFKAVQNKHQVAMLVPTTILAQQHFRTFTERMAGFPISIEVLSRFCTAKQRAQIIQGAKDGTIDILIGTHALVSPDISFANLGLVIIDEEQRFGVRHKEHLKRMRKLVDVLTLSATPIPRTLYMSMTGARDMSLLQTPPRERMAIETIVATSDDHIIRKAVLRELKRDGQIYYLHNRVMTIHRLEKKLTKLLPEARIEVAHGQMKSTQLSGVMQRFTAAEFDILLCTTIIESGMDIPRANTIIIDRADRFGLADLYQLRGRVGRSNHKAYAYMLLPPHGYIDSVARERIQAIRKHSDLGSGFNLAVRDMEIRGAGNILGAAQSGHIAAVGFGIYCQLLKRSIAKLKGEKPPPLIDTEVKLDFINLTPHTITKEHQATAFIPTSYITNERIRITTYRRIAESTDQKNISDIKRELKDRFGKLPPPLTRLLKISEIRIIAATNHIQLVEVRNNKIIIKHDNKYLKPGTHFPTLTASKPDAKLNELSTYLKSQILYTKGNNYEL